MEADAVAVLRAIEWHLRQVHELVHDHINLTVHEEYTELDGLLDRLGNEVITGAAKVRDYLAQ